jgi:tRNA pseudouridine38-40 synthase
MYCASFRSSCTVPADRLPYAVNAYLPRDIAVTDARDVPDDFHAIYSCVKKEYAYEIKVSRIRDPFDIDRAYYYRQPLDLSRMRDAARHLVGTHDFAAMRSLGTPTRTTTRTVHWYEIDERDGGATLRVCADGFLYNMARAMAGTLLYVSEGKLAPDDIPGLLASRERAGAGPTVPPQGLYLNRIWYNSTDMFAL